MDNFRFEDLEIWKIAIVTSGDLFDIADAAEEKKRGLSGKICGLPVKNII